MINRRNFTAATASFALIFPFLYGSQTICDDILTVSFNTEMSLKNDNEPPIVS